MNFQHMKEMEFIRQIQADIQDNKNSTESAHRRLSQCGSRISAIEDRLAVSIHEQKDFFKISRDYEKSIH